MIKLTNSLKNNDNKNNEPNVNLEQGESITTNKTKRLNLSPNGTTKNQQSYY